MRENDNEKLYEVTLVETTVIGVNVHASSEDVARILAEHILQAEGIEGENTWLKDQSVICAGTKLEVSILCNKEGI